jgi:hypothetical protein
VEINNFVGGRSAVSGSYTLAECGTIERYIVTEQNSLYGQRDSEWKKNKREENKG